MAKVRPKKRARVVRPKRSNRAAAAPPREPDRILYTFKENSAWVAGFVPFDLVAQGSTEAEARQRLDSAIAATILWDIEDGVEPLSRVKQTPKHVVEEWARKYAATRAPIAAVNDLALRSALGVRDDETLNAAAYRVADERDSASLILTSIQGHLGVGAHAQIEGALLRVLDEAKKTETDRDRLHTKCSDLVKQQDDWDNKLRGIMDTSQFEQVDAAATRLVEEVQAWRSGCEAAFGGHTANPRSTLIEIAKAQRDYREKHYDLERLLVVAAKDVLLRLPDKEHAATCTSLAQNHPCDCGFVDAVALREQVEAMQTQHEGEVP